MTIYGGSNKNLFTILPTNANKVTGNNSTISSDLSKNKYNVQVNDQTKVAQIYKQGELGPLGIQSGDVPVGTVNLTTGKFTPDAERQLLADSNPSGNVVEAELKYFNSPEGIKQIKGASSITVQKGSLDNGATAARAQANAQSITGTNVATADANTLAQQQQAATAAAAESVDATDIVKTAEGGAEAKGRNTEGTYGNLVYPIDIRTTAQDVIRFTILTFLPTGLNIAEALKGKGALGSRPKGISEKRILGTIILPIPGNISDTNSCNWGDDRLDAFSAVALNTALTTIQKGFGEGAKVIGETVSAAVQTSDTSQGLAAAIAAQAAGGKATTILGRTQGAVFNENLELLFSGPELRSFSFTFKMSARNKTEADEIVKIIRAFKQSMSAQTTSSTIFLKAPNTYKIEYLRRQKNGKGDTVHTRLGKIKECALLTLTTNYAPEGQYAVYNDGTPVSYEIQMQFKELEPIFNADYDDVTKDIGF